MTEMSLFKQLKTEQLEARKAKDAVRASLLTTLIGEIQTAITGGATASQFGLVGSLDAKDEDTFKVIKKFIKNAETSLSMREDDKTKQELAILQAYMPQPLSDTELEALVAQFANIGLTEGKSGGALVGYVMKQLKEGYTDRYDASKVKGLLTANG